MALSCSRCDKKYDTLVFAFDRVILCECGNPVGRDGWPDISLPYPDDSAGDELQRHADRVTSMILFSDLPDVDLDIAIAALRRRCEELMPDRIHLFDWVYGARFKRLREQFPRKRVS
ncbi:MAG: hypothetical protein ABIK65_01920 [Candidatus Eisenbacteria bacterium]